MDTTQKLIEAAKRALELEPLLDFMISIDDSIRDQWVQTMEDLKDAIWDAQKAAVDNQQEG